MTDLNLHEKVIEIDKTLSMHLTECAATSRETGRDIRALKRVVWFAATALIGGQFAIIAFFLAPLFVLHPKM